VVYSLSWLNGAPSLRLFLRIKKHNFDVRKVHCAICGLVPNVFCESLHDVKENPPLELDVLLPVAFQMVN
jgi:hypothetical protein